mmetsp:Transcript_24162/g.83873  ORF Transcript_24162/g.83873 Transcript_24162/m.83873 type:complete len:499 (-) Transcript_24162:871-2367(-)
MQRRWLAAVRSLEATRRSPPRVSAPRLAAADPVARTPRRSLSVRPVNDAAARPARLAVGTPVAASVPRVCGGRRSASSSPSAIVAAAPQLLVFQEAQKATELANSGHAADAASLWERVVDICEQAMGPASPATQAAIWQWSNAYHDAGDVEHGARVMKRAVQAARSAGGAADALQVLRRATSIHLGMNNTRAARETAREAQKVAASVDDGDAEVAAATAEATAALVDSACAGLRWDDKPLVDAVARARGPGRSPVGQARALRNLAVQRFLRDRQEATEAAGGTLPAVSLRKGRAASARLDAAREALHEALELLPSAADGAGADGAALKTEDGGLLDRAGTLLVLGVVDLCGDRVKDASAAVREAITVYEGTVGTGAVEFAQALALLGTVHHAGEQAVTAEGLFRSALDKLAKHRKAMAPSGQRALRLAQLHFADLCSDWEQREREAEKLVQQVASAPLRPNITCGAGGVGDTEPPSSSTELRLLPSFLPYVGSHRFPL